tara:strand:+ start:354 stop:878 length:525 start_codon:yes stop_codon:yes gene_type:complete
MSIYNIPNNDLLNLPYNYSFSKFSGKKFIQSYFKSRNRSLKLIKNTKKIIIKDISNNNPTIIILNKILKSKKFQARFDILLKRFEVTKKIYDNYSIKFVRKSNNYSRIENYFQFGLILVKYYSIRKKKNYLNALLKLNDLLLSRSFFNESIKFKDFEFLIIKELEFIKKIYEEI